MGIHGSWSYDSLEGASSFTKASYFLASNISLAIAHLFRMWAVFWLKVGYNINFWGSRAFTSSLLVIYLFPYFFFFSDMLIYVQVLEEQGNSFKYQLVVCLDQ